MTIFIRNAKLINKLYRVSPAARTAGETLTTASKKETPVARDDSSITPPTPRRRKPSKSIGRHQQKNLEDRARKAETIEAARNAPPQALLNLLTYPTRLKQSRIVAHCVYPGNPGVKQRARFVRATGTVFTPKATKESEREIGWTVKIAMRDLLVDDASAFGLRLVFYVRDGQRKDIDNMTKLVFDGITGIAWEDDSQVKEMMVWSFEDAAHPRTEILIYTLGEAAKDFNTCLVCQTRFRVYPSWVGRPYCSRACASFAQRNRTVVTCAGCGKSMERILSLINGQREYFCSKECQSLHHTRELICAHCHTTFRRAVSLIKGKNTFCSALCRDQYWNAHKVSPPQGACVHCGGPVTRKEYTQCVGCRYHTKELT